MMFNGEMEIGTKSITNKVLTPPPASSRFPVLTRRLCCGACKIALATTISRGLLLLVVVGSGG